MRWIFKDWSEFLVAIVRGLGHTTTMFWILKPDQCV